MHHEPPARATQKPGTAGQYLTYNQVVEPDPDAVKAADRRATPRDGEAPQPAPVATVVTWTIPSVVTEDEWKQYPAEVKKYVRDAGLHEVHSDEDYRSLRAEYEAPKGEGAPQDKTAAAQGEPAKDAPNGEPKARSRGRQE